MNASSPLGGKGSLGLSPVVAADKARLATFTADLRAACALKCNARAHATRHTLSSPRTSARITTVEEIVAARKRIDDAKKDLHAAQAATGPFGEYDQ